MTKQTTIVVIGALRVKPSKFVADGILKQISLFFREIYKMTSHVSQTIHMKYQALLCLEKNTQKNTKKFCCNSALWAKG